MTPSEYIAPPATIKTKLVIFLYLPSGTEHVHLNIPAGPDDSLRAIRVVLETLFWALHHVASSSSIF